MNFIILGAGGIGSYYGAKLLSSGHKVIFIARGENLKAIQQNGLKLQHPRFRFSQNVSAMNINEYKTVSSSKLIDAVLITTKSTSTRVLAEELSDIYNNTKDTPYLVSLQNGVENEEILSTYLPKDKIIGALSRKIGAHIIKPGVIEATGKVETIIGQLVETKEGSAFLNKFSKILNDCDILCTITKNIKLELWKKLIINNGVNAICALLKIKTGPLMNNEKLSKIVYGLMCETANAAKADNINILQKDVDEMYKLIKNFDSIKPSMLVDREFNRALEIDEICGVVIKYCDKQGINAPYTQTISTLLEFLINNE